MPRAPRPLRILQTLRYRPLRTERIYREIAAGVGAAQAEAVGSKARSSQRHDYEKYLDFPYYLRLNVSRAVSLGLADGIPPRRVLDIGCGAGLFLLVCRHLGHAVQGLDLDRIAVFNEAIAQFGIPRVVHEIRPYDPLPRLDGEPFDVITAFAARFERYEEKIEGMEKIWEDREWIWFLRDLRPRLAIGGTFYVKLNPSADHFNTSPKLREAFASAEGFDTRFLGAKRISLRRVA